MVVAAALVKPAAARPPADVVELGETHVVVKGDLLPDIARANDLGYVELLAANPGVDPWVPTPGTVLILPTTHIAPSGMRPGLVANLGDMRLYYQRSEGDQITSFPMGIGRDGWQLRPQTTHVIRKRVHPTWAPPPSIRSEKPWLPAIVPAGPDNPLGDYSLDLALGLIRIHGTNLPDGVGRRSSHGCLRLYPEDIANLFPDIPVGMRVTIVDQSAKLGWIDGSLWLEANPSQDQADAIEDRKPIPARRIPGLRNRIIEVAGSRANEVEWSIVRWAEDTRPSVPVRILRASNALP